MTVEQRYRFIYKPLVFAASLAPVIWLASGVLALYGASLGVDLGADPIKEILHTCGKTALNFLLLTLLVTPVRQLAGWTHLIRLRRMLGLFAFFYALLHFAVYFALDQELNFASVVADIAKRPYITVGFMALLLLVPLAVTSTNRMMRRLGRRWHKLHRLIYVVAVLGVVHYYWQVKRDVREPLIYAGILALLLAYRVVKRVRARRPATSKSVSATTPERI